MQNNPTVKFQVGALQMADVKNQPVFDKCLTLLLKSGFTVLPVTIAGGVEDDVVLIGDNFPMNKEQYFCLMGIGELLNAIKFRLILASMNLGNDPVVLARVKSTVIDRPVQMRCNTYSLHKFIDNRKFCVFPHYKKN